MTLPEKIRVVIGKTVGETKITDLETGEAVNGVKALSIELDSDFPRIPQIEITLCGVALEIEGIARYRVDPSAFEALADRLGYDIQKRISLDEIAKVRSLVIGRDPIPHD